MGYSQDEAIKRVRVARLARRLPQVLDELPEDLRMLQATVRRFMREEIIPEENKLPHDAIALANRVQRALRRPFRLKGNAIATDASIGIALAPVDGGDPDERCESLSGCRQPGQTHAGPDASEKPSSAFGQIDISSGCRRSEPDHRFHCAPPHELSRVRAMFHWACLLVPFPPWD